MKKLLRRTISTICALSILFTVDSYAYAANNNATQRKEIKGQIDFNEMNVAVINQKELSYFPKYKDGKANAKGEEEVNELKNLIAEVPEMEKYIVDKLNENQNFYALGYTTLYLTENADGELVPYEEKITSNGVFTNIAYAAVGSDSIMGTCTSSTGIYRGSYNSTTGKYNYLSTSNIHWSTPNYIGGSSYHGSGEDYLLQTCPNSFVTTSDNLYPDWLITTNFGGTWQQANPGTQGVDYWRSDGGNNYVKWCIKDEPYFDPFGACVALQNASLYVNSDSRSSTDTRKINSYYVHTWTSMSISLAVTLSTAKEVQLTITPQFNDKSWQLYSYVTFVL